MTPYQSTTTARRPLPQIIHRGAGVVAFLSAAALMLVALIILWLGQTSESVYKQGADALVIRAVLRTDTDPVAAEILAERVRNSVPDSSIEVINEAMGRSLLALQEPWIAEMPEFDVTPLPTLLEIRHPDLLTEPASVSKFVVELGKQPEVDFVAYNETAHDRLVKLADSSGAIETHAMIWLLMAVSVSGLLALLACMALAAPYSLIGAFIKTLLIWLPAWALAWLLFRGWEATAIQSGEWQRLGAGIHLIVGVLAGVIIACTAVGSWGLRRVWQ